MRFPEKQSSGDPEDSGVKDKRLAALRRQDRLSEEFFVEESEQRSSG